MSRSATSALITITGGSGFVGQLLRPGLEAAGYRVRVFDRYRGPLVDLLRRRRLIERRAGLLERAAPKVRSSQLRLEQALRRAHLIRPTDDDITGEREALVERFAGSRAVIHLAGIPHPHMPGATDEDFWRLNYQASVNVFEAAKEARVPTFVFASSAQVYRINAPVSLAQLPILESNHLPLPAEGQSTYGFLKGAVERFLDGACQVGNTQAVALRLECPGFRSNGPANLYISTSIENLIAGFHCALRAPSDLRFGTFNIADAEVDPSVVDIQAYIRRRWPYVPNHTTGNECLLSTEKARRVLGFRPAPGGRYIDPNLVW